MRIGENRTFWAKMLGRNRREVKVKKILFIIQSKNAMQLIIKHFVIYIITLDKHYKLGNKNLNIIEFKKEIFGVRNEIITE